MNGVTRREFLAAAGAMAIAPGMIGGRRIARLGADPIRLGIIGCGGRSTIVALQALAADPGVVVWAMGDVFADRLASGHERLVKAAGEAGQNRVQVTPERRYAGFDAYQGVIGGGVDAVVLTTPPHFRARHIGAAVEAGKHVFAETPVAVDGPGVRSVLASAETARSRNVALQVGFCWRYSDAERASFQKIRDGIVGDVVTVYSTYHGVTLGQHPRQPGWTDMEWQLRNWLHFTWLSGDHVVEQAVHSIDRLSWAIGEKPPVRATSLGGRAARSGAESGNIYDHFTVVYEYESGHRGFHTCRQIDGCPRDNSDYVYGTRGMGVINGWGNSHEFQDMTGKKLWTYDGPRRDMYQTEQDEFFATIRAGTPNNDAVRGAMSTLMAVMGRMSAYSGQTVTWEQAMNSQEDLSPAKYEMGPMPVAPVAVPGKAKAE